MRARARTHAVHAVNVTAHILRLGTSAGTREWRPFCLDQGVGRQER